MNSRKPLLATLLALASAGLILTAGVAGCTDDNNRVPTKAENDKADANRQASIDKMNLPPDVKAQMKAHMGGPPVASPGGPPSAGAPAGAPTGTGGGAPGSGRPASGPSGM